MERIITKSFARLMGRGIHRGFITHEELNKSLGKRNLSKDNLTLNMGFRIIQMV